jgi:hypothetical protein
MFGTISRVKVKPGHEKDIEALEQEFMDKIRPAIDGEVLWLRGTQNEHPDVTVTVFLCKDKQAYTKLADDPAMDELFQRMMEHYEAEPSWEDVQIDSVLRD